MFFVFFNEAGFGLYFVIVHELLPNDGEPTASYIEGTPCGNIRLQGHMKKSQVYLSLIIKHQVRLRKM